MFVDSIIMDVKNNYFSASYFSILLTVWNIELKLDGEENTMLK